MSETRKIVAIVAADVAGYARLIGTDESGTLSRLRDALNESVFPTVISQGGRIVKTTGDGLLAEFASAVSAVRAAIDMQTRMGHRNVGEPLEHRLDFRIGINVGEVVVQDDDIYGDAVNIAARLEGLARIGGVCVSDAAHQHVAGKLAVDWTDGGHRELRHIERRVRVWHWAPADAPKVTPQDRRFGRWRPTIAVLPFDNLSGDPEQEYFADGLTEDLITALTHWRSFPVVARNSTFTYKGRAISIPEVAQDLNASYVLEGSVRKAGKRVRVTGQLIDGATGHHVWAERYDRDFADIFALQDELTSRIAAVVAPEVSRSELRRTSQKRPDDLDAWDHVLRGDAALAPATVEGFTRARDHFEKAVALDPGYSDAQAGLATSYYRAVQINAASDPPETLRTAIEIARKAIDLDPSSARAHFVLSTAYILRNEHKLALAEAHLAHELNPNDPVILHALGNKSDLAGDPEGVERMELAQRLNPRDPRIAVHYSFLARAYLSAGRTDEAIAKAHAAVSAAHDYAAGHFILALALAHAGYESEAAKAIDRAERAKPGIVAERTDWKPYTDSARNRFLLEGLRRAVATRDSS